MISETEYLQALAMLDALTDAQEGSPEFEETVRLATLVEQYHLQRKKEKPYVRRPRIIRI